jgi:hypothetical protein
MCTPRSLWETPEVTTVRAAIRTMAACQLANEPSDPPQSRLSHSSSSSHRSSARRGSCGRRRRSRRQRWRLVSQQMSHLTHRNRGRRTAPAAPTGGMCTPGLLWETPEVTTVRAAIRTNAMHESFAAAPNRAVAPSTPTTQFVDSNTGNSSQPPVFACLKTRHGLCNSPVPGL